MININEIDFSIQSLLNVPIIKYNNSNDQLNINTIEQFNELLNKTDYNFIQNLDFNNLLIVGDFCQSILINQPIINVPIYLYGSFDISRIKNLILQIINEQKKIYPNSVCLLIKHSNMLELITLLYCGNEYDQCEIHFTLPFVNTFIHLFDIKFKFQIMLHHFDSINSIFEQIDIDSLCIGYNKTNLFFNDKSIFAYKYHAIQYNKLKNSLYYDTQILKQLQNGFNICLPNNQQQFFDKCNNIEIGSLCFYIKTIDDNIITIDDAYIFDNTYMVDDLYHTLKKCKYHSLFITQYKKNYDSINSLITIDCAKLCDIIDIQL